MMNKLTILVSIMDIVLLYLKEYYLFLLITISFIFFFFFCSIVDKLKVNKDYKYLIFLFIILEILGELFFYRNLEYYDKILHFIVPLFITLFVYSYIKRFKLDYPKTTTLLIVIGMITSFELFEYFVDFFFDLGMLGVESRRGTELLDPLTDTMWDLIMGVLGSIFYLISNGKIINNNNNLK